jgi:hypothetical protein
LKLSPVSSAAGGGKMEIVRTGPATTVGGDEDTATWRVAGRNLLLGEEVHSGLAIRQSWASSGSSSPSGIAPSAAFAAAMLGQRAVGSFSSILRTALSNSGGQSSHLSRIGRGGCSKWACMTVRVEPEKGDAPVIIS